MNPRTFVPPTGIPGAKIMLVGEQPGKREVQWRKPFVGPAGKELQQDLHHAGIPTTECYFTNVIKDLDKPLNAYISMGKGSPTISAQGQEYINRLKDEIEVEGKDSNVIVAVGNIALFALTGRTGITKWRGSIIESTLVPSKKVIPIIHPATVIPPKNVYLNKYLIVMDLVRAKEQAEFPEINLTKRNCIIEPSFEQAMGFLDHCYQEGLNGAVIDADIEVVKSTLSCISFAYDEFNAISIPFYGPKGDYFTITQEAEIMRKIEQILSHPTIAKAGQNFIFDMDFLMTNYGIKPDGPLYDTMIAQRISMADMPAGLDFIASIHTDIPYYKDEGKQWMKVGGSFRTFWNYNAMDSVTTAAVRDSQLTIINQQKNDQTLSRKLKAHYPYLYMMQRGVLVDMDKMMKMKADTEVEIARLKENLYEKAGYEFNPNSPPQVMRFLHDVKGLKPYKKRTQKGWVPTSDEDAMKRHARNGTEEARIILDIRGEQKRLGTYLDESKVDPDGRIRGQYSPHKTVTGRPSSSQNIITKRGCVPGDAEVLTPFGWRSFDSLSGDEEIIQYYPSGKLDFTFYELNTFFYGGRMIRADTNIHKGLYTPEHRLPKLTKQGNSHIITADKATTESNWFLPLSGHLDGSINIPEIRILVMIQSDGSIERGAIRFSFKKQRKIDRCLELFDTYNIAYTEQAAKEEYRRFAMSSMESKKFISLLNMESPKLYGSWLLYLDLETRLKLLDELKHWDGTKRGESTLFFTSIRQNADWIATTAHISGMSATIHNRPNSDDAYGNNTIIYTVNIKPRQKVYQKADHYQEEEFIGKVYCPTVPTGLFLIRYKGYICITGNSNMQNWPHDLKSFLIPDPGYWYIGIDLSQIENRIVAYIGRVIPMIDAFEKGIDLHRLTAAMIFNKPFDEVSDEPGSVTLGDGRHSERDWGKKANHSLNYDFGFKNFALKYEIPEREAKWIVEKYHRSYPEVREGFHALVKTMLQTDRYLINLYGRRRKFLGQWGNNLFKDAYAHIPQSTTADKIDEEGLNYIYYNQDEFKSIELLDVVHDSVGFQIPLSVSWEKQARMIKSIKESLETTLEWRDREFTVPADVTFGLTLNKEDGIEIKAKDFPSDINTLASTLRETYQQLSDNKTKEVL